MYLFPRIDLWHVPPSACSVIDVVNLSPKLKMGRIDTAGIVTRMAYDHAVRNELIVCNFPHYAMSVTTVLLANMNEAVLNSFRLVMAVCA